MIQIPCYIRNNPIECLAAFFSILGGFFFPSINNTYRVIGAILWCAGNILWVIFAQGNKKWALFILQLIYLGQNTFAIWNVSVGGVI